ncbi:hypothetical protein HMPREF3038_03150 [Akkermansia sp. KLE1797]|nr:hypothetical protein HMPREF3038_03150 [Akkermansia sp. KLE1797]KXU52540.1 hypothetical protein HMPREF3039_03318 [Akkermansia sp. KLE1798]KZA03303.1 hypothetical protein HMPREF1326_03022 [Akkermansia sp. KLE1605]
MVITAPLHPIRLPWKIKIFAEGTVLAALWGVPENSDKNQREREAHESFLPQPSKTAFNKRRKEGGGKRQPTP